MRSYYSEGGLRKWVSEKWVDIGAPKKNGKYQPCGRSQGERNENIQNVYHLQKLARMTKPHKRQVQSEENEQAGNKGPKPTNVKTFAKK